MRQASTAREDHMDAAGIHHGHHKRHPIRFAPNWARRKTEAYRHAGGSGCRRRRLHVYLQQVLENALIMVPGPYRIPNVWIDGKSVATNNIPNGAFR
jgi:CO/xanthine dehydrogenase Mo-binding subunit